MNKLIIVSIAILAGLVLTPSLMAGDSLEGGPELETSIRTGFNMFIFQIYVENRGDETAYNVSLTNVSIEGNVLFNFQEAKLWSEDIEPGELTMLDPNSMAIGFGKFTLSMTVACDQGISSTSTVNGVIFGPVIFIP
jgi:hypothetical protein